MTGPVVEPWLNGHRDEFDPATALPSAAPGAATGAAAEVDATTPDVARPAATTLSTAAALDPGTPDQIMSNFPVADRTANRNGTPGAGQSNAAAVNPSTESAAADSAVSGAAIDSAVDGAVVDSAVVDGAAVNTAVKALRLVIAAGLAGHAVEGVMTVRDRADAVQQLVTEALDVYARQLLRQGHAPLDLVAEEHVRQVLMNVFVGAGRLQPLLDDTRIETININGHDDVWVQYRDGTRARAGAVAASDAELEALLRNLGAGGAHERRFDRGQPELSMQLPGGQRLFALMDVTDRLGVSIRLHPLTRVTLEDLLRRGTLTCGMVNLFTALVRCRTNIVVSGGPARGKTTLLRALATAIPSRERVFTVEDAFELNLSRQDHPDLLAMQTRDPNIEGAGGYDMNRLLLASLRMTPDRVIVGEVRGAEVVQMAKAMSIGIDGSMATVHASSSKQALSRLVTCAMEPPASYSRDAATALIGGAVHIVVHLEMARGGVRVVSSVREVVDVDGDQILTNEIYQQGPDGRGIPATPPRCIDQLITAGFDPALLDNDRW